jgi:hypothetical protein
MYTIYALPCPTLSTHSSLYVVIMISFLLGSVCKSSM